MKKLISLFLFFALCNPLYGLENSTSETQGDNSQEKPPVGRSGVVLSTMKVGSYTYVELDEGDKVVWLAGPYLSVKKGDKVRTSKGSEMRDFYSKLLQRNFPVIFFVGQMSLEENSDQPSLKKEDVAEEATIDKAKSAPAPLDGEIVFAEGVYSLAFVFDQRGNLQGKEIKVRGKIVKSTGFILGRHWYHIQDGTDMGAHNADLVMTTDKEVEPGDVIEAVGRLKLDRDFGSGYKYPIILENAKVTILKQSQESTPQP